MAAGIRRCFEALLCQGLDLDVSPVLKFLMYVLPGCFLRIYDTSLAENDGDQIFDPSVVFLKPPRRLKNAIQLLSRYLPQNLEKILQIKLKGPISLMEEAVAAVSEGLDP